MYNLILIFYYKVTKSVKSRWEHLINKINMLNRKYKKKKDFPKKTVSFSISESPSIMFFINFDHDRFLIEPFLRFCSTKKCEFFPNAINHCCIVSPVQEQNCWIVSMLQHWRAQTLCKTILKFCYLETEWNNLMT